MRDPMIWGPFQVRPVFGKPPIRGPDFKPQPAALPRPTHHRWYRLGCRAFQARQGTLCVGILVITVELY